MTGRRYPSRPIVGIGAVVLGPEGVLLIQRGKPPRQGSWSLPGGAQKLAETVNEAAVREVREETGVEVEVLGLVDVVDSIRRDNEGTPEYHYTLVDVAARFAGGALSPGADARDARWFTPAETEAMDLWSETRRVIALAVDRFGQSAFCGGA